MDYHLIVDQEYMTRGLSAAFHKACEVWERPVARWPDQLQVRSGYVGTTRHDRECNWYVTVSGGLSWQVRDVSGVRPAPGLVIPARWEFQLLQSGEMRPRPKIDGYQTSCIQDASSFFPETIEMPPLEVASMVPDVLGQFWDKMFKSDLPVPFWGTPEEASQLEYRFWAELNRKLTEANARGT